MAQQDIVIKSKIDQIVRIVVFFSEQKRIGLWSDLDDEVLIGLVYAEYYKLGQLRFGLIRILRLLLQPQFLLTQEVLVNPKQN